MVPNAETFPNNGPSNLFKLDSMNLSANSVHLEVRLNIPGSLQYKGKQC